MKHELQNIISGKSQVKHGTTIQAATNYIRNCKKTSDLAKGSNDFKKQEEGYLIDFANQNALWREINIQDFISNGAEQLVYLKDQKHVVKLNDAIYYASWEDYFINLLLNNYFFPDTAYQLIGFYKNEKGFYAVVEQIFVLANNKVA